MRSTEVTHRELIRLAESHLPTLPEGLLKEPDPQKSLNSFRNHLLESRPEFLFLATGSITDKADFEMLLPELRRKDKWEVHLDVALSDRDIFTLATELDALTEQRAKAAFQEVVLHRALIPEFLKALQRELNFREDAVLFFPAQRSYCYRQLFPAHESHRHTNELLSKMKNETLRLLRRQDQFELLYQRECQDEALTDMFSHYMLAPRRGRSEQGALARMAEFDLDGSGRKAFQQAHRLLVADDVLAYQRLDLGSDPRSSRSEIFHNLIQESEEVVRKLCNSLQRRELGSFSSEDPCFDAFRNELLSKAFFLEANEKRLGLVFAERERPTCLLYLHQQGEKNYEFCSLPLMGAPLAAERALRSLVENDRLFSGERREDPDAFSSLDFSQLRKISQIYFKDFFKLITKLGIEPRSFFSPETLARDYRVGFYNSFFELEQKGETACEALRCSPELRSWLCRLHKNFEGISVQELCRALQYFSLFDEWQDPLNAAHRSLSRQSLFEWTHQLNGPIDCHAFELHLLCTLLNRDGFRRLSQLMEFQQGGRPAWKIEIDSISADFIHCLNNISDELLEKEVTVYLRHAHSDEMSAGTYLRAPRSPSDWNSAPLQGPALLSSAPIWSDWAKLYPAR